MLTSLVSISQVHTAPCSEDLCLFLQGYPGPRGDPGEPVSILSYCLYWTDVVPTDFMFFSIIGCSQEVSMPFLSDFDRPIYQPVGFDNVLQIRCLKLFFLFDFRVSKEPLDPKEMMETLEIQALM